MKTFIKFRTIVICTVLGASFLFLGIVSPSQEQTAIGLITGVLLLIPLFHNGYVFFANAKYREQQYNQIENASLSAFRLSEHYKNICISNDVDISRHNAFAANIWLSLRDSHNPELTVHKLKDYLESSDNPFQHLLGNFENN